MCAAHGTTVKLYRSRRGRGLSVEQALDPRPMPRSKAISVTGPDGTEYASIAEMCRKTGRDKHRIYGRIRIGWTREDALNGRAGASGSGPAVTGPDGNAYPSISAMCRACGLDPNIVSGRLRRGQDLGTAVRPPEYGPRSCEDHTGRRHASKAAMCKAWNVNPATYEGRIRRGWTVEQALTAPPEDHCGTSDPFGIKYASDKALAADWYVHEATYRYHERKHPGQGLALACAAAWPGTRAGGCEILACVAFPWFLCRDGRSEILLHALELKKLKKRRPGLRR